MFSIKDKVNTKLAELSTNAMDALVSHYAEKEYAARVNAAVAVCEQLTVAEKELKRASKPDVVHYDSDGKEIATFSKAQIDAKKKATERVERLSSALTKAFDDGDWTKLIELSRQTGGGGKQEAENS